MLAELNSFYDAFSYKPTTNEVPDHVAVETGFVAYLRLKELYALESGDTVLVVQEYQAATSAEMEQMSAPVLRALEERGYYLARGDRRQRDLAAGQTSGTHQQVDEFLEAGATHLIVMTGTPFDLGPVENLLALAQG